MIVIRGISRSKFSLLAILEIPSLTSCRFIRDSTEDYDEVTRRQNRHCETEGNNTKFAFN